MLRAEVRRDEELSDRERAEICALIRQAWAAYAQAGSPSARRVAWLDRSPWAVLVRDNQGRLVSHVGMLERTILAGERRVRVGGVARVATHPERWRQGAATLGMKKAMEYLCRELGVEFGLLFPSRMGAPLYRRLGWRVVKGPLVCDQPRDKLVWTEEFPDNPPMALPCRGDEVPEGPIDLCGLPW